MRYVSVRNAGENRGGIRGLVQTRVFQACYYPSRDPACPVMKSYRISKVIFKGNAVINSMGPVFQLAESTPDTVSENVFLSVHCVHDPKP